MGYSVKKLLTLTFPIVVLLLGFEQESETQAWSQPIPAQAAIRATTEWPFLDSVHPGAPKPIAEELRAASAKAIKLIQHSQVVWYKKEVCTSCHHQLLTEIPLKLARERGVAVDEAVARNTTATAFAYLKDLDAGVQGYDYIDVAFDGWSLVAAHEAGVSPSLSIAAYAAFIASSQRPDGSWLTIDGRPPQAHSPFTATAVCAQAITHYLPERLKGEKDVRLGRAREWLLKTRPRTTEDKAFHLLGLRWTGADLRARKRAAQQLIAEQHDDGGWAQLPGLTSDAYATGEVLEALREGAGLPTGGAVYQRGVRFLLKTQKPDGSWMVKSRLHPPAPVSPPYFDTDFPYQHDQFISIMGTSWAASALLRAIPPNATGGSKPAAPSDQIAAQPEWVRAALVGSAAELRRQLDGGMKPDAKTAEGTTALMLAARDLEKVRLLIERGADVNASAATGITPLMVAARHRGNADVIRLLLKSGAKANADKEPEVRNDASALFFAVMAGDVETVDALVRAGARIGDRMKVLGRLVTSPLLYATFGGDSAMVEYLIGKGANPNEVDEDGISVLGWAALNNHIGTVQLLLARGAQVNHLDSRGMTPLLYVASIDYGDTAVLEKLIAAGADLKAKNKEGLTAFDLARSYRHATLADLLAKKVATR
jgi:ankyrin repeat protein